MAGTPRDLATPELWQASLQRSLARRRAAKLQFLPGGGRAKRLALGTLLSLAAAPAAMLADAGTASAAGSPPARADAAHADGAQQDAHAHPVRLLQRLLHVAVDGVFGPETLAAVKAYQRDHGIRADGVVGPETWGALGHRGTKEVSALPWALPRRQAARASASHRRARASVRSAESDGDAGRRVSPATSRAGSASASVSPSTSTGSAFALCVANHEAGSPGSTSAGTVNWAIEDAPYEGGFQWLHSSWIAQGGGRYAARAVEATPAEQIAVFQAAEPSNPGAWPSSVPACGG